MKNNSNEWIKKHRRGVNYGNDKVRACQNWIFQQFAITVALSICQAIFAIHGFPWSSITDISLWDETSINFDEGRSCK